MQLVKEKNELINMNNNRISNDIYNKVFLNIEYGNVDVFLCGKPNDKGGISFRNIIRKKLETNKNISIWYPEELFAEFLDRKKYDLLTLESRLADNSDVIVIVCESPGSIAELGAFVNNKGTSDKVIVLIKSRYYKDKSFIRRGLVEFIRKRNKNNVFCYSETKDDVLEELEKYIINKYYKRFKRLVKKDLNIISGQYYFIILLLFFYNSLSYSDIMLIVEKLFNMKYLDEPFDIIFKSAIKRLFREGMAEKDNNKYLLTQKGYEFAKHLLSCVVAKHKTRIINSIRFDIMNEKYYKGGIEMAPSS